MRAVVGTRVRSVGLCLAVVTAASFAVADPDHRREELTSSNDDARAELPPWRDLRDVPMPDWVRTVVPIKPHALVVAAPGETNARRGVVQQGAYLPFFGALRASGCDGRWLNIGPFAWLCSNDAQLSPQTQKQLHRASKPWQWFPEPRSADARIHLQPMPPIVSSESSSDDDGLPYRYFFAREGGALGYASPANAGDDAPIQELDQGFSVAVVEQQVRNGDVWLKTTNDRWFASKELVAARSSRFHGVTLAPGEPLDVAWVVASKAQVFASPAERSKKPVAQRERFRFLRVLERSAPDGKPGSGAAANAMLRVQDADGEGWVRARDVAVARRTDPPEQAAGERWIDVDIEQQTLVAYEGAEPVFATLVSTGRGPEGSDYATHVGVHRIWVKLFTSNMDNLESSDVESHYALEDVPWVQFFDHAIALHGAFWHQDFGRRHSHGCVNLAPIDARWLFAFTSPHMPAGWTGVFPSPIERGTVVRVR